MPRIWVFGNDVNTDQMVPGRYAPYMLGANDDVRRYAFIEARPDFAPNVQPGDLIIAGPNFGCGSSREYAPLALKRCGVGAIIAPLFARIFFRNALNLGIPCFTADIREQVADGDVVDFDLAAGLITNNANQIQLPPPEGWMREVWAEGGIVPFYRRHGRFPATGA
ncbi:homoaconitate hydratase [Herpetosiphon giganteus]|uniref:LeuD/DmdB family oxidoreductase small subunit n=1 Tax=Herpetosiphon giganteus TaxID=2029754 RepID=UPI00195832DD|nr:homoaconitate hydratase [Herpetosiphon giganteus]MBM7846035.1 methanogen homoaconitase small subunit [Herpetosiphon giganteus]